MGGSSSFACYITYMWGVFETNENIHCIPSTQDGMVLYPHTVNDFCACIPEAKSISVGTEEKLVMMHNEMH